MALWKVEGEEAHLLQETNFVEEKIPESKLEEWVESNPKLLGEPLFVFGRQVQVEGLLDTIDLLALDLTGAVVVIEMKRADLRAPVDIQGLRYASYVSRWDSEALDVVASGYFADEEDRSLEERFQEFAESEGTDEDYELNHVQRVIIVGQTVKDRLGSVALWLRDQGVDIKLVEIHPFREANALYLEPLVIIPPPTTEQWEIGSPGTTTSKPWAVQGMEWHRKRAGKTSFERAQSLIQRLNEAGLVQKSSYNQKHYIAVWYGSGTWLRIQPRPKGLRIDLRCDPEDFDINKVAEELGLEIFAGGDELKEKLALSSSVGTYQRNTYFVLRLRLKEDYDIHSEKLIGFFRNAAKKRD